MSETIARSEFRAVLFSNLQFVRIFEICGSARFIVIKVKFKAFLHDF